MSVYPCSVCRQRRPGKMATAYWAWFDANGDRCAWKQRFCAACAQANLHTLLLTLRSEGSDSNTFACVSCGTDASQDSDPVYLTLYVPGREPEELALQLDGPCAANMRSQAQVGAERLADRGGLVRGPSPTNTTWDAIGLAP